MPKLCTYIVKYDHGLAPNPFFDWCTLAVCTPNHQGIRLEQGDWIAGFYDKSHGYKFLYAMVVEERIRMDDYFKDSRFQDKKPISNGTPKQHAGDNFYSTDKSGNWYQHDNPFHLGEDHKKQDTRYPWVYVAPKFWYLGERARDLPPEFLTLVGGYGSRVHCHPPGLPEKFMAWVEKECSEGMLALPRDM